MIMMSEYDDYPYTLSGVFCLQVTLVLIWLVLHICRVALHYTLELLVTTFQKKHKYQTSINMIVDSTLGDIQWYSKFYLNEQYLKREIQWYQWRGTAVQLRWLSA